MRIPASLALALTIPVPLAAADVSAADPASVARVLVDMDLGAEPFTDGAGDPALRSDANGTRFTTLFYGCKNGRDCATVQFYLGYADVSVSSEQMNEWNRTHRFARAYVDGEGDPVLEMDVDLDDGGMSTALFEDNVEFWLTLMNSFEDFLIAARPVTPAAT